MVEELAENAVVTSDQPPQQNQANEDTKEETGRKAKAELLCFGGGVQSGGLQANFARFRQAKKEEIKYRNYMAEQTKQDRRDPAFKRQLRQKFVDGCIKYFGVPYAKRYHNPGDPLYDAPLFLDCCALVRQVVYDLREDFGFKLDRWNQAYQYDTLPIDLTFEQLQPGDLVFYSGIYFNPKSRQQKHHMVHVEVFTGGETGEQSIGARWQKGVVKYFDSYKFESTAYHSIQFHFKSLDTWLEGICKSHCQEHSWNSSNLQWAPGRNSIFGVNSGDGDYDEADLDAPVLDDDEIEGERGGEPLPKDCFIGVGNNPGLAKNALVQRGYQPMSRGMQFSDKFRFKWVQAAGEVNYMKFVEGRHIVNHISNSKIFTNKIESMEMLADLNRSLQSGAIASPLYGTTDPFLPQTFRLDVVADFVNFLRTDNNSLWLVKKSTSNMGRGIEMVRDPAAYKEALMTRKDKWGESAMRPEEVREVVESPAAAILASEQGSEATAAETTTAAVTESQEATTEENKEEQKAKPPVERHTNLIKLVQQFTGYVVQRYLERPCLIHNRKFDLRCFMVIICCKPYFVFSQDGYARISLNEYSTESFGATETLEDGTTTDWPGRMTHLTNLAIQKRHPEYKARKEEVAMTMGMLRDYCVEQGLATVEDFKTRVTDRINEVMRLIFLQTKGRLDRRFGCFEVYGFDFMLDGDLAPILLEINVNPALFLDTTSQASILPKLVQDVVNMADAIHEPHQKASTTARIQEIFEQNQQLEYEVLYTEESEENQEPVTVTAVNQNNNKNKVSAEVSDQDDPVEEIIDEEEVVAQEAEDEPFGVSATALTIADAQIPGAIGRYDDQENDDQLRDGEQAVEVEVVAARGQQENYTTHSGANRVEDPEEPAKHQQAANTAQHETESKAQPKEALSAGEQRQLVFKNVEGELNPAFRVIADKEVSAITRAAVKSIKMGSCAIGAPKSCETVVRENVKDYKGIIKAVGYDSPNKKFKEILSVNKPGVTAPQEAALQSNNGSQQNLSLQQLQQKENKSIYAVPPRPGAPSGIPLPKAAKASASSLNADLGDLDQVIGENNQQVSSNSAVQQSGKLPGGKPPAASKPPKQNKDGPTNRKPAEPSSDALLQRLHSEAEKSRAILEKQAIIEQKRKLIKNDQDDISDVLNEIPQHPQGSPTRVVETAIPDSSAGEKKRPPAPEASNDLVKRLRMEKKARQKKLEEYQKKIDAKFAVETEGRRKAEEDRELEKKVAVERKRGEIESNMRVRKQNRARSVVEMIERTRQISAGVPRPNVAIGLLPANVATEEAKEAPPLPNLSKIPLPKSKIKQEDMLLRNSQKYDDLMKQRRDELRRKRGALELNSDLDLTDNEARQAQRADLPPGVSQSAAAEAGSYRSKLHQVIKQRDREAKEQHLKEQAERAERTERMKNYSRSVKDLYQPGAKRSASQRHGRPDDVEVMLSGGAEASTAEERKSYLGADTADGNIKKEIKPRRRSSSMAGSRAAGDPEANAGASSNPLAEQHAKRLKVRKSSRVSIGAPEAVKPPRFTPKRKTDQSAPMGDINLQVSAMGKDLEAGLSLAGAQLPQSLPHSTKNADNLHTGTESVTFGAEDPIHGPMQRLGNQQSYLQPFAVPPRPPQAPMPQGAAAAASLAPSEQTMMEQQVMPPQRSNIQQIEMDHDVNDAFIDNIRAKLDMLDKI